MEPARSRTSAIPSGLRRRSEPEVRHAPTSRTASATTVDNFRISPPYTPSSRVRHTHTRGARMKAHQTSTAGGNGARARPGFSESVCPRTVTRKSQRGETIDPLLLSALPEHGPHASP
uniref:B1 n=1 Tax=Human betaherpesvirus 6 TaxID=10368 RepID=A0A5P9S7G5_9BETA|nr:B1 [Human betaherpesvirus 6]QFV26202.1 B1 [Human betaherpesvirus 6]QFV47792.1 hypothetical protein [Human betaherpesvirus 6]QFV49786.1 hypothetical protein [Human betaherpesvirus 6]QFV49796.1 hypothetical protein [Human betaherpesvirus 6]